MAWCGVGVVVSLLPAAGGAVPGAPEDVFGPFGEVRHQRSPRPDPSEAVSIGTDFSEFDEVDIGLPGLTARFPVLIRDAGGVIHLLVGSLYFKPDCCDLVDLYHLRSNDGGFTWSPPTTVVDSAQGSYRSLEVSGQAVGRHLDLTWTGTVRPGLGQSLIVHAQTALDGPVRRTPEIAAGSDDGVERFLPSMAKWDDRIVCVYQAILGLRYAVYVTQSTDDGLTWNAARLAHEAATTLDPFWISRAAQTTRPGEVSFALVDTTRTSLVLFRSTDFGASWEADEIYRADHRISEPWLSYDATDRLAVVWNGGPDFTPSNTWFGHVTLDRDAMVTDVVVVNEGGTAETRIEAFDVLGRRIGSRVDHLPAGFHLLPIRDLTRYGSNLPAGVYLWRVRLRDARSERESVVRSVLVR
jgi:hypothetical protein